MPEVADSAALLFDPYSEEEIVRAMRDLLLNPELRSRMERLGMQRAAMFSWEKTASKTLELYYRIAGQAKDARPATKTISAAHS
jgi:glycosyltransferase involved in cell wall biosynthesis